MENNKRIAEFMGIEEAYNPNGNDWVLKKTTPDINGDTDILECCKNNDLKYHSSWDWLLPVVEKCLEKHNNLIDGRDVIDTSYSSIAQALQVVSLKETYKAVVEFIKWHNKATKTMSEEEMQRMYVDKKNEIIAEFMGLNHETDWLTPHFVYVSGQNMILEDMQFHSSWDWLMPVVQKIEQTFEGVPQEMFNISLYSDISEVYNAAVEFIKSFNKNK